jgi:hypothetical protein
MKKRLAQALFTFLMFLTSTVSGQTPTYQQNINATEQWLVSSSSILPDGAILYTSTDIKPYFSNLAAMGLVENPAYHAQVQAWMRWYLNHINYPADKWGLACTIYDFKVSGSNETSTNDADSTDSYAATFLSLAWAYWKTGDPNARAYIQSLKYPLDCVGGVIVQTKQANGLTWAKPDYQIQYLMDNCEVYRGLRDLANIFDQAFQDANGRDFYNAHASDVFNGIQSHLWDSGNNNYLTYVGAPPTDWGTWYPDSTAQLFPAVFGILTRNDPRAQQLYDIFNSHWPNWTQLRFNDAFPWVMVSAAAALRGDSNSVNRYINKIQSTYVSSEFPWPWYCLEAGWFIRVNRFMLGETSALIASQRLRRHRWDESSRESGQNDQKSD